MPPLPPTALTTSLTGTNLSLSWTAVPWARVCTADFNGLSGMPGLGGPSEAEVQKVVSKALDDVVKDATDRLKSGK